MAFVINIKKSASSPNLQSEDYTLDSPRKCERCSMTGTLSLFQITKIKVSVCGKCKKYLEEKEIAKGDLLSPRELFTPRS